MIKLRNIAIAVLLTMLSAGCGVRGAPELPPNISEDHNKQEKTVLDGLI